MKNETQNLVAVNEVENNVAAVVDISVLKM